MKTPWDTEGGYGEMKGTSMAQQSNKKIEKYESVNLDSRICSEELQVVLVDNQGDCINM